MPEQFPQRASGLHDVAREIVHLDVLAVADDDPLVRVEHDEALRHIVESRVEPGILVLQIVLAVFERANRPVQNPQREDANGEEHAKAEQATQGGNDARV